jgi:hypothetical protein
MAPGECGRGSRAAADDTASGGTAGTGACPKQAFGFDQTQFWDSGIDSGVILGSILISFWDQFCHSGSTGACPKPFLLSIKTITFNRNQLFYLIKPLFSKEQFFLLRKTIVFIANEIQGSPRWSGMLWVELWEGL